VYSEKYWLVDPLTIGKWATMRYKISVALANSPQTVLWVRDRLRMESKTSLFTATFRTFLYFHGRNNARLERYRKVLHNAKLPSCPRCFPRHGITIDIKNSVKSCYRAISRILRWINIPVRRNAFSEYRRHGTSRYPPPPCRLFLPEQQCNERKPSHCFRICLRDRNCVWINAGVQWDRPRLPQLP